MLAIIGFEQYCFYFGLVMASLFEKLSYGVQKVKDTAHKASTATGFALSGLSTARDNKISDLKEERTLKVQEKTHRKLLETEQNGCIGDENRNTELCSLDGIVSWLSSVQCNLLEPYGLILSDLRLIAETVDSPEAVSMSIEGLVRYLDHALEMAENEKTKRDLKEIFVSMIRVLLMFFEAKINYAEDRNSENGNCLLFSAGEELSLLLRMVVRNLPSELSANVDVRNPLSQKVEQSAFFKKAVPWAKDGKLKAQKHEEYINMLKDTFSTLSAYSHVIGSSVPLNRILSHNRKILVDDFKNRIFLAVRNTRKATIADKSIKVIGQSIKSQSVVNLITNPSSFAIQTASQAIYGLSGIIADNVGDSLSDFDAFISAMEGLKEKSSVQKHEVQLVESELHELQMEYSKLGVFQVSAKKESKVAIDAKMKSLQEIKLKLDGIEKRLNDMNNIFPDSEMKKKEIAEYDESLSRIESMF